MLKCLYVCNLYINQGPIPNFIKNAKYSPLKINQFEEKEDTKLNKCKFTEK